jgi:integral membrane protein (TIGR00529 family)
MEREIVSLAVSILMIVLLVRFKVDLGLSMLAGAAALALVAGRPVAWTAVELGRSAIERDTLLLLGRIITIIALGALAGKIGYLDRFVLGLRTFVSDNRIVVALIPAFGGLLPMPGGAMLTAPMVESASKGGDVTPEQNVFLSYWFRHVWEYIWPLYPGVVVVAALIDKRVGEIFTANWSATVAAIAAGFILVLWRADVGKNDPSTRTGSLVDLIVGILPFAVVIVGVLAFKLELILVVLAVIVLMAVVGKVHARDLWLSFRRGISFQIVALVLGVAAYKYMLTAAGVIDAVPAFFLRMSMPEVVVIAAVPFIVGLITGVTLAFIGVSFPLLLPLFGAEAPDMELVMLAFVSGFAGCLLSPVHLCLVLTREYFEASLLGVYKMLVPATAILMAVAFAIVLL